jgi:hypothetical protein
MGVANDVIIQKARHFEVPSGRSSILKKTETASLDELNIDNDRTKFNKFPSSKSPVMTLEQANSQTSLLLGKDCFQ